MLQSVFVVSPPTVGEFTSTSIMNVLFPGAVMLAVPCTAGFVYSVHFNLDLMSNDLNLAIKVTQDH